MKAAQLVGPKRFEFKDVETPAAQDDECLIKVQRVSICGSDIRRAYGPIHPEERYPFGIGEPCHEVAGVVVESRTDRFREGQRVIVLPEREVSGGLVEYLTSQPDEMVALPDYGDLSEWVLCQPSGTVLYACKQMGSIMGKTVAIFGQGAIGLSFTMLTSKLGAQKVIGVDPLDYRLEYSGRFGATHTVNPDREDLAAAIAELTDGNGADITVEAAGFADTLDSSLRYVTQYGLVIMFGIQSEPIVPVDTALLTQNQPTLMPTTAARGGKSPPNIADIVALRDQGWIDPAQMITHRMEFTPEDVNRAYKMYEDYNDGVIKAVLRVAD